MPVQKQIIIIDYGVGNLQSLKKAFAHFGAQVRVSEDAEEINEAGALVLPGVGSFAAGMRGLEVRNLISDVCAFARSGKPMLGICLGAQLMLTEGHEFGVHKGLGIVPGRVIRFGELTGKEKIPQVGWNSIYEPEGVSWKGSIFAGLGEKPELYFVHSYILVPEKKEHRFGLTTYGGVEFCSIVRKDAIIGVQFHPEKSGKTGLAIIDNFIGLVAKTRNN